MTISLDDLPLGELSQWLTDNMLPDARTFLLPGTVQASLSNLSPSGATGTPNYVSPLAMQPQAIGSAIRNSASSVPTGASLWNAYNVLQNGTYTTASSTGLTIKTVGLYLVHVQVRWDAGTTGLRASAIAIGGTIQSGGDYSQVDAGSANQPGQSTTGFFNCTAGQVIQAALFQSSGAAVSPNNIGVRAILLAS